MRKTVTVTLEIISNNGGKGLREAESLVGDVADAFRESGDETVVTARYAETSQELAGDA